jgi:hypothetical protein
MIRQGATAVVSDRAIPLGEYRPMPYVRVNLADGNHIMTEFNGTQKEAEDYYLGKSLQFGDTEACPEDKLVAVTSVEYFPGEEE